VSRRSKFQPKEKCRTFLLNHWLRTVFTSL
jgi:hypothetical protein